MAGEDYNIGAPIYPIFRVNWRVCSPPKIWIHTCFNSIQCNFYASESVGKISQLFSTYFFHNFYLYTFLSISPLLPYMHKKGSLVRGTVPVQNTIVIVAYCLIRASLILLIPNQSNLFRNLYPSLSAELVQVNPKKVFNLVWCKSVENLSAELIGDFESEWIRTNILQS